MHSPLCADNNGSKGLNYLDVYNDDLLTSKIPLYETYIIVEVSIYKTGVNKGVTVMQSNASANIKPTDLYIAF